MIKIDFVPIIFTKQKLTLGHLDKKFKNDLKMILFGALVFAEIVFFFLKKKRINGNTGGTGLKKRSLSPHLQENLFF